MGWSGSEGTTQHDAARSRYSSRWCGKQDKWADDSRSAGKSVTPLRTRTRWQCGADRRGVFQYAANGEHGREADGFGRAFVRRLPGVNAHGHDNRQGSLVATAMQEYDDRAVPIVVVLVGMHPMV